MRKFQSLEANYPNVFLELHPTLNENLRADKLSAHSDKRVWWLCCHCAHAWKAKISKRTDIKAPSGCPECWKKRAKTPRYTETLDITHPEIAAQWHPTLNGDLTPDMFTPGSTKRIWWKCPFGEDHVWSGEIKFRTYRRRGCPCCSGHKVVESNCLATVAPHIAAQWHPTKNGDWTPNMVTVGTPKKFWWLCSHGHEWFAAVSSRTGENGSCCPSCQEAPEAARRLYFMRVFDQCFDEEYVGIGITNKSIAGRYWNLNENLLLYPYFILDGRNETIKPLEKKLKKVFRKKRFPTSTLQEGLKDEAFCFDVRYDILDLIRAEAIKHGIDTTPIPAFNVDLMHQPIPITRSSHFREELTKTSRMV